MDNEALRRDLFLLIGYLLTSAYGLYDEPASYGPLRLTDAAGRLLSIMEARGLSDPFLKEMRTVIEPERFMATSDEQWRATLNDLAIRFAGEMVQRLPNEGERL